MDRKSKQKIGYVIVLLFFFICISALLHTYIKQEKRIQEQQLQELQVIYPESGEMLAENFSFYQQRSMQKDKIIFLAILLLILFFVTGIWLIYQREKRLWEKQIREETERIYEQLQKFQQGRFEQGEKDETVKEDENWGRIHEKLRELGFYMSDMKERISEEENSTKALITDISHQLKTPLASIRMSYDLAEEETLTARERKEFRETEAREIQKLEELLDELVKLSRLENHMIQVRPERNSLKQTISEAVEQVFMKAYEKQIDISLEMAEDMQIPHDRKWTVEALANVLENAVKYSENGTDVVIRVQTLATNVLIEVEDEGMGIAEEELHKIFHRFYRGSQAKSKVKEGAGVGLYLARNILEQQGGTILAKRKAVKGTVFKIILPYHSKNKEICR